MSELIVLTFAAQAPDGEVSTLTIEKWKQNSNCAGKQIERIGTASFCQFLSQDKRICEQAK